MSYNKLSEGSPEYLAGVMGDPKRMLTPQAKASSQVPQKSPGNLLARSSAVLADRGQDTSSPAFD